MCGVSYCLFVAFDNIICVYYNRKTFSCKCSYQDINNIGYVTKIKSDVNEIRNITDSVYLVKYIFTIILEIKNTVSEWFIAK